MLSTFKLYNWRYFYLQWYIYIIRIVLNTKTHLTCDVNLLVLEHYILHPTFTKSWKIGNPKPQLEGQGNTLTKISTFMFPTNRRNKL